MMRGQMGRMGWLMLAILALFAPAHFAQAAESKPVPAAETAFRSGDYKSAAKLWKEACEAGNPSGCYELSIMYRDGEGMQADPDKAKALLVKACDGDEGRACFNLALLEDPVGSDEDGEDGGTSKKPSPQASKRAFAYFEKGCSLEHQPACANMGSSYIQGRGVPKDVDKGIQILTAVCDRNNREVGPACFSLSQLFDFHGGTMIRDDLAIANRYLERGCSLGDTDSCMNLGYHYRGGNGVKQNWKRARALYAAACNDADGLECLMLSPNEYFGGGSNYTKGNVVEDKKRAAGLYSDGCDDGLAQGCASLAYLIMRNGKAESSETQLRQLLGRALELMPDMWLAKFLLQEIDAKKLDQWDARQKARLRASE
jgi:uncharacterized protein